MARKKSAEVLADTIAALDPSPMKRIGELIEEGLKGAPIQQSLEGMEEPVHEDISSAALSYANHRDDRMAKQKTEATAYKKLAALMSEHGLKEYSDRSRGVWVAREDAEPKFKVKLSAGSESFHVKHGESEDEAIGEGTMESPNEEAES